MFITVRYFYGQKMFMEKLILLLICLIVVFKCDGQSTGVANNLYDSFQPLGCGQVSYEIYSFL